MVLDVSYQRLTLLWPSSNNIVIPVLLYIKYVWNETVIHTCVSKLAIIDSDDDLSPEWVQAIIWTNAGILLIRTLGTNFSGILRKIDTFLFTKLH